ncbi:hypothetical protein [Kitasatospora cheerisanensis]|uniref:Uncharacterized protein n=1 Tax=Kitasatospora cheerisanensis KCTC 2395 TaxID=1348663 RepID=A0A066ZA07_9ACTN|nr:hypothetical protein [Kitasatospora cheerisanensis]KDN86995.1 hypothetical protein KCH_10800 [Kitasatospora cheerisanensis KCTC 2395]
MAARAAVGVRRPQGGTAEEWRAFLTAVGVRDGLLPVRTAGATTTANGNSCPW